MNLPKVVSESEWRAALDELRAKEKEHMRESDRLAAERRRLPMVKIGKDYELVGADGPVRLVDLFEDRKQLLLYHFMFAPDVHGWPEAGCDGCSMVADQIPHKAHLHARDTTFAMVSRAPLENIERFRERMGWDHPWYSSDGSDFNDDFGMTTPDGETFGLSVFIRDGDDVYRTYFTHRRGVEALGTVWALLDLTPFGRQEDWEETPEGRPQTPPYEWMRLHDEYEDSRAEAIS